MVEPFLMQQSTVYCMDEIFSSPGVLRRTLICSICWNFTTDRKQDQQLKYIRKYGQLGCPFCSLIYDGVTAIRGIFLRMATSLSETERFVCV